MPQCAVIGCPGQKGHCSLAALSHTVKTKSSFGASGPKTRPMTCCAGPRSEVPLIRSAEAPRGAADRWVTAGAVGRKYALALAVQNRLGHDGAGRVAGTEKQNVVMIGHDSYSFASAAADVQQPGWQQAALGLPARINALKNLLFTWGAIASTSNAASVRNCRASSTLYSRVGSTERPSKPAFFSFASSRFPPVRRQCSPPRATCFCDTSAHVPRTTTSETANRPPGLSTRKASPQNAVFVRREVDHAVRNHDVDGVRRQGNVFHLAFEKFHVGPRLPASAARW